MRAAVYAVVLFVGVVGCCCSYREDASRAGTDMRGSGLVGGLEVEVLSKKCMQMRTLIRHGMFAVVDA